MKKKTRKIPLVVGTYGNLRLPKVIGFRKNVLATALKKKLISEGRRNLHNIYKTDFVEFAKFITNSI